MKTLTAALVAALMSTAAHAVEPVGSARFNTNPGFDLGKVNADNFDDVVLPLAKKEGTVTLFDFTDSFGPLFTQHLIPEFEQQYNIKVDYVRGDSATAAQQLIAAHNAGSPAPADVYFQSSGQLGTVMKAGVMANIPLTQLLPNGAAIKPSLATETGGYHHGGAFLPFHRNQTSIIYDTRSVAADQVPDTLDGLLAWAKAHPGKFIVTSPAGGGSGSGFVQSIAFAKVQGDDCRATLSDFSITPDRAKAYAAGDCMKPVWDYYRELLPVVEITKGNSDTLNELANGAESIATAWEDMSYDFMGRGLLPPTVRQEILKSGQVGGGDGLFFPVDGQHPAAGLVLLNFLMSHDVQLEKLKINGSRSARTDIDPTKSFSPEQAARLIPTAQFADRALPSVPSTLNNAFTDYAVANLLRGQ